MMWQNSSRGSNNNNNNNRIEKRNLRLLLSPHCTANCLPHVHSSSQDTIMYKLCATQWGLIMCNMLCATRHEATAQLSSLTSWNCIYCSFILLAETINQRRKGGNQSTQRKQWASETILSSSAFPAMSLRFTILVEICSYWTVFQSNQWGSHILSSWMVHAVCVFVADIHLSRTWMSGFFEFVW